MAATPAQAPLGGTARLAAWWGRLAPPRELALAPRLYGSITLGVGLLLLCVSLPLNLAQRLPLRSLLPLAALGAFNLWLAARARHGRRHPLSFFVVLVATLDWGFFANAGSVGTTPMYFFGAVALLVVLFHGWRRMALLGAFLANGLALLVTEHLSPASVARYRDPAARLPDLLVGFVITATACAALFWVLMAAYRDERERLREANARLSRALEEVDTLRGLLPLCPSCRKVRSDQGHWLAVEAYLTAHAGANVSHSLCPECEREHFPGMGSGPGEEP